MTDDKAFYVLISKDGSPRDGGTGGTITLYERVGPWFFENARRAGQTVKLAALIVLETVDGEKH